MFSSMGKIEPFASKVCLASPKMHGEGLKYVTEAYETNWMHTVGANINEVERIATEKAGMKHAVSLSCCTYELSLLEKDCSVNRRSAMARWRANGSYVRT